MNNKKGISAIVATVLIILFIVASVTIWATIIPLIERQLNPFEITQEECIIEMGYYSTIGRAFQEKKTYYYNNVEFQDNPFCSKMRNTSKSESCLEYYEMSDTLLAELIELEEELLDSYGEVPVCRYTKEVDEIWFFYENGGYEIIRKDGLTIEMLEENCEPMLTGYKEKPKYVCGKYMVEVRL